MSLKQALDCIRSELPSRVIPECNSLESEQAVYETKGFEIRKLPNYDSLFYITEVRLKRGKGISIDTKNWLQAEYDFLKQIQKEEKDSFWGANLLDLENDRMITFLINTKQNTYAKSFYILPEMYPRSGELWDGKS